jgi:hypothetical protein
MPSPLIFISSHSVSETALTEMREVIADFVSFVEANEPSSLGLNVFLNDEGTEFAYVHIQPGADEMDAHMVIAADRTHRAVGLAPPTSITVYGAPGPILAKALQVNADAGVRVTVHENHLSGFLRGSDVG